MHETPAADAGISFPGDCGVTRKEADFAELLERDQPRAQAVIDVVIVVGDLVGKVADLRFQRGLRAR
jgi:hypothetical protein